MEEQLPKTFDAAVDFVIGLMAPEFKAELLKVLQEDQGPRKIGAMLHHGFGTFVRNRLQLWHPPSEELRQSIWDTLTPEKQAFYENWWKGHGDHKGRTMHADDASGVLIDAVLVKFVTGQVK